MNTPHLSKDALDTLLKEHGCLREEIRDRLKTAFTHVAYAGAVAAFAIPFAVKVPGKYGWLYALVFATLGFTFLCWAALLNMRWVQHAGAYIRWIEARVALHFGEQILGWEHYGETVRAKHFAQIPDAPSCLVPRAVVIPPDSRYASQPPRTAA